jgi:hypothetical protein
VGCLRFFPLKKEERRKNGFKMCCEATPQTPPEFEILKPIIIYPIYPSKILDGSKSCNLLISLLPILSKSASKKGSTTSLDIGTTSLDIGTTSLDIGTTSLDKGTTWLLKGAQVLGHWTYILVPDFDLDLGAIGIWIKNKGRTKNPYKRRRRGNVQGSCKKEGR